MKFTQTSVAKLKAPEGKSDITIWDDEMSGFGIRFRDGGPGSYVIQYFLNGKQAKMTLGRVSKVTLDDARTEAKKQFALIAQKINPVVERAKVLAKSGEDFKAKIEAFLTELKEGRPDRRPRSPGYVSATRRSLNVYFAEFHRFGLGDITRKMVVDELDEIEEERGFRAAGTSQAHLSSYFKYCMRKGYDGYNPVAGTERRNSQRRTRKHTVEELQLIWKATEEPTRYNRIVRLIMLTGMRKTIFGSLKLSEIDRDKHLIDVAMEVGKAKNGEEFLLPMSRQVEAILFAQMPSHPLMGDNGGPELDTSEFIFSNGHVDAEGGFSGWSKAKVELDAQITKLNDGKELPHWVLHDFRRTFMSLVQDKCKVSKHIADVCLYHVGEAKAGLNGTYNKATYLDEKRDALQKWADYIETIVSEKSDLKLAA